MSKKRPACVCLPDGLVGEELGVGVADHLRPGALAGSRGVQGLAADDVAEQEVVPVLAVCVPAGAVLGLAQGAPLLGHRTGGTVGLQLEAEPALAGVSAVHRGVARQVEELSHLWLGALELQPVPGLVVDAQHHVHDVHGGVVRWQPGDVHRQRRHEPVDLSAVERVHRSGLDVACVHQRERGPDRAVRLLEVDPHRAGSRGGVQVLHRGLGVLRHELLHQLDRPEREVGLHGQVHGQLGRGRGRRVSQRALLECPLQVLLLGVHRSRRLGQVLLGHLAVADEHDRGEGDHAESGESGSGHLISLQKGGANLPKKKPFVNPKSLVFYEKTGILARYE